jgi:hypothetical protein
VPRATISAYAGRVTGDLLLITRMNHQVTFNSQVHEIHPSHAFLMVPDAPQRSHSDSELPQMIFEDPIELEEQCIF